MKMLVCVLLLALITPAAVAAEVPEWAYPVAPKPVPGDNTRLKQIPGSARQYTEAQIDDGFDPPDWFPDEHPPMPQVVAHGMAPSFRACALCHLPSGEGHPESSDLAGLPVSYLMRQISEFKNGGRTGVRAAVMLPIAQAISDADLRAAAEYYAALKPSIWTNVVEADTVPKTYVGHGAMRFAVEEGGTEPLGRRIIVLPQDPVRARSRDPHSGFVDYVPVGSIETGKTLVTTGGSGKTIPCATCHGPTLRGLGEVPGIVGRPPTYVVRQLHDIQTGHRSGSPVELMKPVVAPLDLDDMVAIAAYLGSLER